MHSLERLGTDIILQIIRTVHETSPSSLDSISRACRQLHLTVQSVRYSKLEVGFSKMSIKASERIVKHVIDKTSLCDSVRAVSIHCFPHDLPEIREAAQDTLDLLVTLFLRLRGLKRVSYKIKKAFALGGLKMEESSWDHKFGLLPTILSVLHKLHSRCLLSVSFPPRIDLVSCLSHLEGSTCLYSLKVAIMGRQYLAIEELFRVLPTCPNFKALKIMRDNAFDPYHEFDRACRSGQGRRADLVKLKDLEFQGPNLCSKKPGSHCVGQLTSSLEEFDLSTIERLSLTHSRDLTYIALLSVKLRSLSFEITQHPITSDLEGLLHSMFKVQSLTELSMTGCTGGFSIDSMLPLKSTLKRLKIHEHEARDGICKRRVLSDQEIERLGKVLPNLEYLSLDLNYHRELPLKTLSTISYSFPSLIHQELNLEINVSNHCASLHPAATLAMSQEIWTHLWTEISAARLANTELVAQPRLRALTVNAGSFRQIQDSTTDHTQPRLTYKRQDYEQLERREQQRFQVRRDENASKAAQGLAHVTCDQIEKLERKIGTGTVAMVIQLVILEEARERAKKGALSIRDTRINRSIPPGLPDNDYELRMAMDTLWANYNFRDEASWLEELSKRS